MIKATSYDVFDAPKSLSATTEAKGKVLDFGEVCASAGVPILDTDRKVWPGEVKLIVTASGVTGTGNAVLKIYTGATGTAAATEIASYSIAAATLSALTPLTIEIPTYLVQRSICVSVTGVATITAGTIQGNIAPVLG